jgi:AcrR family transcriptional regulator
MRAALLEVASQALAEDGVHGLSTRRLAQLAGTSTTAIYTLFGGKEGLFEALFVEGFTRLSAALRAVAESTPDPLERLRAMNARYRAFALAHPADYGVMFERVLPGHVHSAASLEAAWMGMQPLLETVRACMSAGVIAHGDVEAVAMRFWASGHGLVSLELAGYFRDRADLADRMHEDNIASLLRT